MRSEPEIIATRIRRVKPSAGRMHAHIPRHSTNCLSPESFTHPTTQGRGARSDPEKKNAAWMPGRVESTKGGGWRRQSSGLRPAQQCCLLLRHVVPTPRILHSRFVQCKKNVQAVSKFLCVVTKSDKFDAFSDFQDRSVYSARQQTWSTMPLHPRLSHHRAPAKGNSGL
jgi:hypothetical protein